MSRCRDRPHNVNELQSVVFYVLVVDQLLESQHTPPLTWLMNPSLVPITWFSLAPGWGIPGELSVQTRSYPLEKRSSLVSLRKKIALYLYDTSSHPSRWHDLHWLLSRWYKSALSPMPCTMYVDGLGSGEFCTFTAAIRDWSPISLG